MQIDKKIQSSPLLHRILDDVAKSDQEGAKLRMKVKEDVVLNDSLKGLSAQDNMDIVRIVRDFNKGKLPLAIAKSRLAAYGFDAETINEILEQ